MPSKSKKTLSIFILAILIGFIATIIAIFSMKASFTFSQISIKQKDTTLIQQNQQLKNPNKINILVLGLRGRSDPYGGLLSDSILVISIDKNKSVRLISIPRDLFVRMPIIHHNGLTDWEKINYAYAFGEKFSKDKGLLYAKAVISKITGLYLDYSVAVNFQSFKQIIRTLGGIDIYLSKPFIENHQWGYTFYLPAGNNHLNAEKALYFARSRYSTSDFDRMRRQQQIIMAIKKKATSLGVLSNPTKLWQLMDIIGKNIVTDIQFKDFKNLFSVYQSVKDKPIKKIVLDNSTKGVLINAFLRKSGDHLYGDIIKIERIKIKSKNKENTTSSTSTKVLPMPTKTTNKQSSTSTTFTTSNKINNSTTTPQFKEKRAILRSILISSHGRSEQNNGAYILLPKSNNFDKIKSLCQ
ncbi:MAG TPA: LytR family transcriptional regulator [Candidatus Portnoybacteria bacterium]|nr:LytR family transcriptional regulator [Candidatus Portnoybacteria bacterium]